MNVVANLIAAFIIYVSAVALGYLSAPGGLQILNLLLANGVPIVALVFSVREWRATRPKTVTVTIPGNPS